MSDSPPSPPASAKTPYEQAVELKDLGLNSAEIKAKLLERGLDAESAAVLAHSVGAADPRPSLIELNIAQPLRESWKGAMTYDDRLNPPSPSDPSAPTASSRGLSADALLGGVICLVGIVVTVATYLSATERGGGAYVIAWGAILFGGFRFIRGLTGAK